jgi:hypothetical protein
MMMARDATCPVPGYSDGTFPGWFRDGYACTFTTVSRTPVE